MQNSADAPRSPCVQNSSAKPQSAVTAEIIQNEAAKPIRPPTITSRWSNRADSHAAAGAAAIMNAPDTNTVLPISRLVKSRTRNRNTGVR